MKRTYKWISQNIGVDQKNILRTTKKLCGRAKNPQVSACRCSDAAAASAAACDVDQWSGVTQPRGGEAGRTRRGPIRTAPLETERERECLSPAGGPGPDSDFSSGRRLVNFRYLFFWGFFPRWILKRWIYPKPTIPSECVPQQRLSNLAPRCMLTSSYFSAQDAYS